MQLEQFAIYVISKSDMTLVVDELGQQRIQLDDVFAIEVLTVDVIRPGAGDLADGGKKGVDSRPEKARLR